ncbi:MAG: ParB/RepB/Spo0J family partition protein [Rickettsiales bacterium]|nr:ParB/RepB/Spo0J family partition protein [Rickettsiales bacterium]
MSQTKLGKGLSALMDEEYSDAPESKEKLNKLNNLDVHKIRSGKYQPRKSFEEGELGELAASIAQNGVMQPIVVRPVEAEGDVAYEIIAGERRWRASKRIGLDSVPAIIRVMTDQQALELALVENIQREDLSGLEEAAGYQQLIEEFNYTQEQLAGAVGKSRSHIANLLRLLSLPDEIKVMLEAGNLSIGHARALMTAENAVELAKQVVAKNLNVRQTEKLAKGETSEASKLKAKSSPSSAVMSRQAIEKNEDILALEETLAESLGLKVQINDFGGQQGEIVTNYESLEELDMILRRLGDAA